MPPKKGKKKSKAKLEAERKAQEEEELRLKEEEERLEAERLAKQREEDAKALARRIEARNDEVDRFIRHREEMSVADAARTAHLHSLQNDQRESAAWDVHVGCNEMEWPDTDSTSINTYISEVDESLVFQAGDAFKCIRTIGRVILELECKLLEQRAKGLDDVHKLQDFSSRLQAVLMRKLDVVTSKTLEDYRHSNAHAAKESRGADHNKGQQCGMALRPIGEEYEQTICLEMNEIGVTVDIVPDKRSNSDCAVRVCRFPFEPFPHIRFARGDLTVGGAFHVELIRMSSPDKAIVDGWTHNDDAESISKRGEESRRDPSTFGAPIKCCVQLPPNIVVEYSSLLAAKWNDTDECWSSADASHLSYDEDSRTVSFELSSPGVAGILQTRQIDLNYKNWSLGPIKSDDDPIVEFKLLTPRFQVIIHIAGSTCTLLAPEIQEFSGICGLPQSPGQLLARLSCCGLHLLPSDSDAGKMDRTLKKREIEERVYSDISRLSTAFFIKSSRCNPVLGCGQACYTIKESDSFVGGCDPSPMATALVETDGESASAKNAPGAKLVPAHCGNVRCSLIKGANSEASADTFNTAGMDGTESSLCMSQCIAPISSTEAIERVKTSPPMISETVKQLLELTRPLVFAC